MPEIRKNFNFDMMITCFDDLKNVRHNPQIFKSRASVSSFLMESRSPSLWSRLHLCILAFVEIFLQQLETVMESRDPFCESRSRRFQVSSRSRRCKSWSQAYCLETSDGVSSNVIILLHLVSGVFQWTSVKHLWSNWVKQTLVIGSKQLENDRKTKFYYLLSRIVIALQFVEGQGRS